MSDTLLDCNKPADFAFYVRAGLQSIGRTRANDGRITARSVEMLASNLAADGDLNSWDRAGIAARFMATTFNGLRFDH
jgi:hypothetical protein